MNINLKFMTLVLFCFCTIFLSAQTAFNGVVISQKYSIATAEMANVATYIKTVTRPDIEWQVYEGTIVGKKCEITVQKMPDCDYVNYICVTIIPQDFKERNQLLTMLLDAYKKKYIVSNHEEKSISGVQDINVTEFRSDDGVRINLNSRWFFSIQNNTISIFYYARPISMETIDLNNI